jgi:polysaccharide biosynthesis protein PslH
MTTGKSGAIVIGPAWHSCGSHQVFKAQLDAYASMGVDTYFLAVSPTDKILGLDNDFWGYYLRMTPDILATARGEARLRQALHYSPKMLWGKAAAHLRTICYIRTLTARNAVIPASLDEFIKTREITVIHCNHFFNLPMANRIRRKTGTPKVICETHDIQSRHFIQSDPENPYSGRAGTYESYFRDEVRCLAEADELIHLNQEEFNTFSEALPRLKHHLIYPSVQRPEPAKPESQDIDFLIVSSANLPNYHSLCWFLDEVWDDELNAKARLRVIGNVDYIFQTDKDPRYTRYGDVFMSRVEDVGSWYARAHTILAPVTEGQGIAIKTVEALSYGKPFLFSPLALRGFDCEPAAQDLEGLCKTAADFKSALHARLARKKDTPENNFKALNIYDTLFSPEIYRRKIRDMASAP